MEPKRRLFVMMRDLNQAEARQMIRSKYYTIKEVELINKTRRGHYRNIMLADGVVVLRKYIEFEEVLWNDFKIRGNQYRTRELKRLACRMIFRIKELYIHTMRENLYNLSIFPLFITFLHSAEGPKTIENLIDELLSQNIQDVAVWISAARYLAEVENKEELAIQILSSAMDVHPNVPVLFLLIISWEDTLMKKNPDSTKTCLSRLAYNLRKMLRYLITSESYYLNVLKDFTFYRSTGRLKNIIVGYVMRKFRDKVAVWDVLANRTMKSLAPTAEQEFEARYTPLGRIKACVGRYKYGLSKITATKKPNLWTRCIDFLIIMTNIDDGSNNDEKLLLLLSAFNEAANEKCLSEKHYKTWIKLTEHREALEIAEKATNAIPTSEVLWLQRFSLQIIEDNFDEVCRVFQLGVSALKENSSALWLLFLRYLYITSNIDYIEDVFKRGIAELEPVSDSVKSEYITWLIFKKDVRIALLVYEQLAAQKPASKEMYRAAIKQEALFVKKCREWENVHKLACKEFGNRDVDVWENYINYYLTYKKNTSKINEYIEKVYNQGVVSMPDNERNRFIEKYSNLLEKRCALLKEEATSSKPSTSMESSSTELKPSSELTQSPCINVVNTQPDRSIAITTLLERLEFVSKKNSVKLPPDPVAQIKKSIPPIEEFDIYSSESSDSEDDDRFDTTTLTKRIINYPTLRYTFDHEYLDVLFPADESPPKVPRRQNQSFLNSCSTIEIDLTENTSDDDNSVQCVDDAEPSTSTGITRSASRCKVDKPCDSGENITNRTAIKRRITDQSSTPRPNLLLQSASFASSVENGRLTILNEWQALYRENEWLIVEQVDKTLLSNTSKRNNPVYEPSLFNIGKRPLQPRRCRRMFESWRFFGRRRIFDRRRMCIPNRIPNISSTFDENKVIDLTEDDSEEMPTNIVAEVDLIESSDDESPNESVMEVESGSSDIPSGACDDFSAINQDTLFVPRIEVIVDTKKTVAQQTEQSSFDMDSMDEYETLTHDYNNISSLSVLISSSAPAEADASRECITIVPNDIWEEEFTLSKLKVLPFKSDTPLPLLFITLIRSPTVTNWPKTFVSDGSNVSISYGMLPSYNMQAPSIPTSFLQRPMITTAFALAPIIKIPFRNSNSEPEKPLMLSRASGTPEDSRKISAIFTRSSDSSVLPMLLIKTNDSFLIIKSYALDRLTTLTSVTEPVMLSMSTSDQSGLITYYDKGDLFKFQATVTRATQADQRQDQKVEPPVDPSVDVIAINDLLTLLDIATKATPEARELYVHLINDAMVTIENHKMHNPIHPDANIIIYCKSDDIDIPAFTPDAAEEDMDDYDFILFPNISQARRSSMQASLSPELNISVCPPTTALNEQH